MALFKIEKGLAANLAANRPKANEGYAYFTTDDGKFYIDITGNGTQNAVIGTNRICLNAAHADSAGALTVTAGSSIKPVYINSSTGLPTAINYTIQSNVPSNAIFTDQYVKQTAKSDDAEYKLLFSATSSLTSGATEETGYDNNITVNPSTSTITASHFEGALKFKNLAPTFTKVYESTSYYASSSSAAAGTWYFLNVIPDDWYKPWEVRFKIHSYCPNYPIVQSTSYCLVTGSGATVSYANWNQRAESYAHYYTTIYPLKKAGFDAGYGHAIGIQVYSSTSSTTAAYYRTFEIDYYDCKNCTATFLDEPVKWSNWTGTGTTNYSSIVNMNAVDRGLQETGDANSTTISTLYKQYGGLVAGDAIKRYQFVFQQLPPNQNKLIPIFGTDNITTATKTLLTTEFDPLGFIFFYNNSNSYASGANIDPGRLYYNVLADLRYSFNISSTTSATAFTGANYQPLYLRVNINSTTGGASVDGNQPLTSALPTSNDGKYYIYLGQMYDYYRVMLDSLTNHPVFYHNGTEICRYYGKEIGGNAQTATRANIANQVENNLILKINTGTTENTNLYTFNGLNSKILDIKSGSNIALTTATNEVTISHTASGVTAGSYGDSTAQTPGYGSTFNVPYITVDANGHVTGISSHTVKIPASDNADTKVTQTAVTASSYTNWRPIVWGASSSATEGFTPSTVTDQVYTANTLSVQPSSGTIRASKFKGALIGNADTASAFAAAQSVTLTGDVTGTASSTAGWSIATTIGAGKVTNAMLAGSITNNKLANSSMSIAGNTVALGGSVSADTLRTSLGLSNAMHFVGITTTALADGVTNANITIDGNSYTAHAGDVTIYNNYEYVYTGSSWEMLGGDGSYKVVQTAIAENDATAETTTATRFVYAISQNANGVISVKTRPLPTYNNYSLPLAANGTRGGIQIGYTQSGKKYPVQLDSEKAYVEVPWSNTTYSAGTGLSLSGTTFNHTNSVTARDSYVDDSTSASANGGTIKVTDIQYDAQGHITASTDRTITLSQVTYTLSGLGGVGTVSASGTAPLTLSASKSGTAVTITGSVANFVKSGSTAAAGLVPKPPTTAGTTKFLREDGTWAAPSYTTNTDRYVNSATFADDTTNSANSPIKMTLTRAGSDTVTVTANIPKVSTSSAGVVPKGTSVSTQSQSTKFLREDGTWAAPSYTTNTNTDTLVTQTATTTNANYEILFSNTADNTTRTETARKNSNLTFNPSTGTLTATNFNGSLAWSKVTGKPTATGSNTTGISISNHSTTTITGVSGSTTASKASGNNGTASTWEFEEITIPNVTAKGTASSWTFSEVTIPNITSVGTASTWTFSDVTVPIRADSGTTVATSASSATSCDDITAWSEGSGSYTQGSFDGGSGSFTATVTNHVLSFSHTHTAATHGADSHTHTAPSLSYTSRSITGVGGTTTIWGVKSGTGSTTTASKASGSNGTAPTLGTAIKVQSKSGGSNGTAPTLGTAIKVQSMSGGDNSTAPTWAFTDVTVPKAATSSTTVVTSGTHTITDPGHTHNI